MPNIKSETVSLEDLKTETTTTSDPAEISALEAETTSEPVTEDKPLEIERVQFAGAEVLEVLPYGETLEAYHCKLSNGTTAHVPKSLFTQSNA